MHELSALCVVVFDFETCLAKPRASLGGYTGDSTTRTHHHDTAGGSRACHVTTRARHARGGAGGHVAWKEDTRSHEQEARTLGKRADSVAGERPDSSCPRQKRQPVTRSTAHRAG
eukprot:432571-Rhodomonas_salina.1